MSRALPLMAACIGLLLPITSGAQKGGKPTPAPIPLQVIDATGKSAGRFLNHELVAVTVGEAVTLVRVSAYYLSGAGDVGGLTWVPSFGKQVYWPNSGCSGAPLITLDNDNLSAYIGFRPSVAYLDSAGGDLMLYVGSAGPASFQSYSSTGLTNTCYPGQPCGGLTSCNNFSGMRMTVPLEATVNMSASFPTPLQAK